MASIGMQGYQPPHQANHRSGGIDPLPLQNLAGALVAAQHPAGLGANKHHNQVHGWQTGDHSNTRYTFLSPLDFMAVQGAPVLTQYGVFPNTYMGWAFPNGADSAIAAYVAAPMDDWVDNGGSTWIYFLWTVAVAAGGNVRWGQYLECFWSGHSMILAGGSVFYEQGVPAPNIAQGFNEHIHELVDDAQFVRYYVARNGSAGGDTYANPAIFLGAVINWYDP